MGQAVSHNWFNDPVVDFSIHICTVVDDVAYNRDYKYIEVGGMMPNILPIYTIYYYNLLHQVRFIQTDLEGAH